MTGMAKHAKILESEIYIDRLEGGDAKTRRHAALKLARWPNIVVVKHLCDALQDSDRHVRRDAAKSLGIIGDAAAINALLQMVSTDTSVGAVRWGIRALGQIADPAAVSTLLNMAVRAKSGLEITAREAIDQIGIPAVGELTRSLSNASDPIHSEASEGIKRLYRRRRPTIGTFPGGPVVEAVMTVEGLRPQQRMVALEAALSCRMLFRSTERASAEASKLCERLATQNGDEAISRIAAEVMNYISLGRASTASEPANQLMRAIDTSRGEDDGRETLGRATRESIHTPVSRTMLRPGNLIQRAVANLWHRWFAD